MKALKIIGRILLVLVIILAIIHFMAPKEFKVERSVVVNAPAEIVFKNLNSWDAFKEWNPWGDLDSTMKIETEGENGTVGSVYKWEGNDKVGKGRMVKTLVDSNKRVEYDLIFTEPWEDKNKGFMTMESQGDTAYKVSWGFAGDNKFPFSVMSVLMNMDAMLGKDFEKGLNKLKALAEADTTIVVEQQSGSTEPTTSIPFPERKFAVIRGKVPFDKIGEFFSENISKVAVAMGEAKLPVLNSPFGIYYLWDTVNKMTDMSVGFAVTDDAKLSSGVKVETIPATSVYILEYKGDYEKMDKAHNELGAKLKSEGRNNPDFVLEEYIVGPQQEKNPDKWVTKIYYLVK